MSEFYPIEFPSRPLPNANQQPINQAKIACVFSTTLFSFVFAVVFFMFFVFPFSIKNWELHQSERLVTNQRPRQLDVLPVVFNPTHHMDDKHSK